MKAAWIHFEVAKCDGYDGARWFKMSRHDVPIPCNLATTLFEGFRLTTAHMVRLLNYQRKKENENVKEGKKREKVIST